MPWRVPVSSGFCARRSHMQPPSSLTLRHVRLYSQAHSYRPCRDIASILNSPQNHDPKPRDVEIIAHIRSVRAQKKRAFAALGDGSTSRPLQVLMEPEQASGLTTGTAVKVRGSWGPSPGAGQSHEMKAHYVEILGPADPQTFPVQKKHLTPEFLRTIPHLRVRTTSNARVARLRSDCEHHISTYFHKNGYLRLHPPAITSSDCEGAGEVFTVRPKVDSFPFVTGEAEATKEEEFFKSPKYLTVSNQLHLEAFVHEHQRVWALAPTFRAERSDTPRHLSEFYMLEAELRTSSIDEVMDVVEGLVRDIANKFIDERDEDASPHLEDKAAMEEHRKMLSTRYTGLRQSYWPRITYTQAIQMLKEAAQQEPGRFAFKPSWETGLQLEHEKYIASAIGGKTPVFVTDYPKHQKPFYMLPTHLPDVDVTPKSTNAQADGARWKSHALPPKSTIEQHLQAAHPTVACFDLLLPDMGELVGGSLREHRHEELQRAMQEKSVTNIDWYLELRKYGSVPHGGFGLGFDRLLMYLSGIDSVRDVVQWPRYYGKCDA